MFISIVLFLRLIEQQLLLQAAAML